MQACKRHINFYMKYDPKASLRSRRIKRRQAEMYLAFSGIRGVGIDDTTPEYLYDWQMKQLLKEGKCLEETCDFTVSLDQQVQADFNLEIDNEREKCIELCKRMLSGSKEET